MNGQRFTSPRSYFLAAAALVAVGLVLGLGISAGSDHKVIFELPLVAVVDQLNAGDEGHDIVALARYRM